MKAKSIKTKIMPLKKAKGKSKKAINAAVSANIHELVHKGKVDRPMKQIIAIAESAARKTGRYKVAKKK
jgi:hypothetical protein